MDQLIHVDQSYVIESWTLFGIGVSTIMMRFVVRLKTVGFYKFRGDDYFAMALLVLYTVDAATVYLITYNGSNVEGDALSLIRPLTDYEINQFEYGSKLELCAWYSYATLLWTLKGCLLCFYDRMSLGSSKPILMRWLKITCGVTYVAVMLTITFSCWPIQNNWQVLPPPGEKCTLKIQNFLVSGCLNILSDFAILSVPVPQLWKLQVPLLKKIFICALLCSGIFVISAAIIRVVVTLSTNPSSETINRWGVRETFVGIIAINAPVVLPIFQPSFWRRASGPTRVSISDRKPARNPFSLMLSMITTALATDYEEYMTTITQVGDEPATRTNTDNAQSRAEEGLIELQNQGRGGAEAVKSPQRNQATTGVDGSEISTKPGSRYEQSVTSQHAPAPHREEGTITGASRGEISASAEKQTIGAPSALGITSLPKEKESAVTGAEGSDLITSQHK